MKIERYPRTKNNSLQVSSAAENYLLDYVAKQEISSGKMALLNDRFGYLACHLHKWNPYIVIEYKSQEKAIRANFENNHLKLEEERLLNPLDEIPQAMDLLLMKVPKSLDLFRLYLQQINSSCNADSVVVCSFMTKHFSKQWLKIGEEYFEDISQSLAWKKARLLVMKKPRQVSKVSPISQLTINEEESLQHYSGVFSAHNIDYATQFLLDNIKYKAEDEYILDLASGNGIIAYTIQNQYKINQWPQPILHLMDDSFLAIESSKLNLTEPETYFHFDDNLDECEDEYFDLVVSNPPFHFEYEINTEVTMNFFDQVHRCLARDGRFILVFNRHLRYSTLLNRIFSKVVVLADSPKFIVLECHK